MNKIFSQLSKLNRYLVLIFCLLALESFSQCSVTLISVRDTIACGETLDIETIGLGGLQTDDFTANTLSGLWDIVTNGWVIGGPCGTNPNGGAHLWFGNGCAIPRAATTIGVDASCGGTISFDFRQETQSGNCDGPDLQNEGVYLQYRPPGVAAWTDINYFSPIGFPYTGWQNHSFPLPPGAQFQNTQFRWIQFNASGTTWDYWGIDNVAISSCSNFQYSWYGPGVNGFTGDSIQVAPTDNSTLYSVMYTNGVNDTCYDSLSVYVEQPSIVANVTPSPCSGSDTLFAQATIPANCYYQLECWNYLPPPGAQNLGWQVPGTTPQLYHNIDLIINGNLQSNYTMINGPNYTSENYLLPVTDGDDMDLIFTFLGSGANEAMYRLYDSQGNLVTTQGFPGSVPGNFINHTVGCPATATYTYEWSNITSGGVAGLNDPNIQGPLATVAQVTNFQIIAQDSLNPACVAIDTVLCLPNINTITGTMSGVTNICLGDDVQLDFVLNGSPPFDLILDVSDATGLSTTQTYQLDANGLVSSTGLPLIFTPTVSTTYSVLSLSDVTGCPGSITNPALVVTLSDYPSFSVSTINPIICQGQSTILDFNLTGTPNFNVNGIFGSIVTNLTLDASGNDALGNPISISPNATTTYDFTSITGNNGCATALNSSITITVNPPINAGNNAFLPICTDDINTFDLKDIIGPGQDTIGYWTTTSGNQLPVNPNFTFNPQTMPAGNYTYTVEGAPCPNDLATVNISFTNPPFSGFALNQEICINDYAAGNTFDLNSLLISADAGGVWSLGSSIIPAQISPITYGAGIYQFKYEVFGVAPCNDMNTVATLTINPEPVVGNFTTNIPVVAQGFDVDVIVDMIVGSPPFTVSVVDDETPQNLYTINVTPPNMSGLINVIPNNIPITTYAIAGVTDGKGCSATIASPPLNTTQVIVDPYPFIDPFTTSTPVICEGDNASISVVLKLGEAPIVIDYSYNGNNYVYNLGSVGQITPISATIPIDISGLQIGSNEIKINSLTDNSGVSTPTNQLPNSVFITVNANPDVNFSTSTSEICSDDPAILNFNFSAGAPPFSIDYTINSNSQTPLVINGFGNQQYNIIPAPNVGSNTYDIINITDANGCIGVPNPNTALIFVNPTPDINITVSGTNPICQGDNSELFFPILSGTAPFNINYLAGGTSLTTSVDGSGNPISGNPMIISPASTTTYTLVSVTDAKGCFNSLSNDAMLTVNEIPNVIVSGDTEICDQDKTPLFFTFTSGIAPWTVNYNVVSSPASVTLYNLNDTLIVDPNITTTYLFNSISDNNCSTTINEDVTITVNSLPQSIITGGGSVCDDGSTIEVQIITTGGTPNYNISYNAGITNNFVADVESPLTINTNESGTYTISEVIDSKGCIAESINGSVNVYINEFPEAVLQAYPQPTTLTNPKITFIDASSNHASGYWDFGDGTVEFTNFDELTHIYQDTGSFEVMLQIESDSGCLSTAYQTIIIDPDFLVYIPEGFTPNNDLKNDYYQPIVSGVLSYEFSIYTRNGQLIFRTNDYSNMYCNNGCSSAWDGLLNNGDYASAGNYTYHMIVFDLNGKERTFQGNISLMR
ncbi:MAG: hypothetical protein CMD09_03460 [Flavobacteriales bacterium]|nr:hypothetical protein [Flavobacteriales bacterium]OUW94911.1 MAG: hypothetical protein CBD88_05135 [Flavobacteriales bacterium TMED228]